VEPAIVEKGALALQTFGRLMTIEKTMSSDGFKIIPKSKLNVGHLFVVIRFLPSYRAIFGQGRVVTAVRQIFAGRILKCSSH